MAVMHKPLKTGLHHWWPKGLSQFWRDQNDGTTQLSPNGEELKSKSAQFGAITNGHHVKISETPSPWDRTFEHTFDRPDSNFPSVIEWLHSFEVATSYIDERFENRLQPQSATADMLANLTECLASLIVRSPAFRNVIRLTIESYRNEPGVPPFTAPESLVAANMQDCLKTFSREIGGRGKIVVLYSDTREFIFGDGFLHNFSPPGRLNSPRCLIPLTPTMSVLYFLPRSYVAIPRLMTMRISPSEVETLNHIIQVYSRDYIFFRSQKPRILPEFSKGEFLQCQYHKHPWLDLLIEVAAQAHFPSR